jgi:cytochrome c
MRAYQGCQPARKSVLPCPIRAGAIVPTPFPRAEAFARSRHAMDSFEFNKIAGALLGTLMTVVAINLTAGLIFAPEKPEKPGFAVADAIGAAGAAPAAAAPADKPGPSEPIGVVMASADAARGQAAVKACASCHTFEKGGANRVGPNLYGIVGDKKAHIEGFKYSSALAERGSKGEKWGFEELYAFLENPKGYISGTTMSFAGVRRSGDRADIIAYLRSLADSPLPLPAKP